jgi:CheY-like chemotaxis protein
MLYPLSYGGPGRSNVTSRRVPPPAEPRAASLDRMEALGRVLVIDDSEVIRQLITINLELEGFEVVTAVDGQDALEKIHEVQPDVITIDVKMPRMDGLDTVARLRADPRTAGVKIAMVTASAQDVDLRRGETAGVDAYVTKPFDPESLVRTIRDLIARKAS